MNRLVVGLIAAAIWLPLLALFSQWPGGAVSVGSVTVPLTIFVAGPMVYVLRRRLSLWLCLISGALLGVIGSAIFAWLVGSPKTIWAPGLIGIGAISGGVFWLAGVFRNPYLSLACRHSDAT